MKRDLFTFRLHFPRGNWDPWFQLGWGLPRNSLSGWFHYAVLKTFTFIQIFLLSNTFMYSADVQTGLKCRIFRIVSNSRPYHLTILGHIPWGKQSCRACGIRTKSYPASRRSRPLAPLCFDECPRGLKLTDAAYLGWACTGHEAFEIFRNRRISCN